MAVFDVKEKKSEKNNLAHVKSGKSFVRRENRTGIPTQLKECMEQSTGLSFDDVRVNYNSKMPAKLDALAYTQGNRVEIGPGQERYLSHELGHVVQQKLGLVRANARHSSGTLLNTDAGLERQADEIGAGKKVDIVQRVGDNVVQRSGKGTVGQPESGATGEKAVSTDVTVPDRIINLYHGTLRQHAQSIYDNGVELGHGVGDMDFGRGFYTTELFRQASQWANKLVQRERNKIHGAIVKFNVPQSEFDNLNNLKFPRATLRWRQFVTDGRNGELRDDHDTVSGPLLLNPGAVIGEEREKNNWLHSGGQQTAFNTQAAVNVLNRHREAVINL